MPKNADIEYGLTSTSARSLPERVLAIVSDDVKMLGVALFDLILISVSYYAAFAIRFETIVPSDWSAVILQTLIVVIPIQFASFWYFGLYRSAKRLATVDEALSIAKAVGLSMVIFIPAVYAYGFSPYPKSVFILYPLILSALTGGSRFCLRVWTEIRSVQNGSKRVLIVGAGTAGEAIVREMIRNNNYRPVGLVDDDRQKAGSTFHGIKVLGPCDQIKKFARERTAEEIIIAIPSATGQQMRRIVDLCKGASIPYRTLPSMGQIIDNQVSVGTLREVNYSDLLRRKAVHLDNELIRACISGSTVLVTGAGGSIGSELCRQIVRFRPGRLVLLDASEENLFNMQMELHQHLGFHAYHTVLARVQNIKVMETVFGMFRPAVVFHAAAYKHVPMMEINPWEAVFNNIVGSKVVMDLAARYGALRFVLVSTDKAVSPTSVMGVSKRVSELILKGFSDCGTRFMAVRFGNVLGSSGSVIPLFLKQIERGGPVTITHPEMTRFFMLIPEAAQLILQSGATGEGGEIFILKMGRPVKILDLAEDVIRLAGREPGKDIEISFTGLREGEKLHEKLICMDENVVNTNHEDVSVVRCQNEFANGFRDLGEFREWLDRELTQLCELGIKMDAKGIKEKLRGIVPEYTPFEEKVTPFKTTA
jgi:FlaA1/EpsC-like NDP-sugar epimerase